MTSPGAALARATASLGLVAVHPAGVGIDLVDLADVEQLVEAGGTEFLESAWTRCERDECEGSIERLAARWAAKEAVMKALGAGLGQLSPLDIEVSLDHDTGAPQVRLHRHALARAHDRAICGWFVSLCHENGWAAAVAIAKREWPEAAALKAEVGRSPDEEES
jgi:holo-[acyl-carrier protein] synthase